MTDQINGVRITFDDGVFFVSSKRVGKDNYRHEAMSHDGLKAIARATELLGLKAQAHSEAVAEAFNRQRVETLEREKAVLLEALSPDAAEKIAREAFMFALSGGHITDLYKQPERMKLRAAIHSPITQHMGDGTPVYYCPDCGRNEAMPVRFQCDDTEGGAA